MIRQLEWEEIFVDRGDGSSDPGGWEADSGFGLWYEITMYFGSDSYGWELSFDHTTISDFDDPDAAKEAGQADFERRVRSCLAVPSPHGKTE